MAKKMPMFEPERVEAAPAEEKPLGINMELALYRAKVLTRNFQFQGAEMILQKCILFWPEDGRSYVALGKLLCKQSKFSEVTKQHKERILTFGRDYVFKSRSKDIRINWPFREQHLHLCLNNGISDVLPPLQPPSLQFK